MTTGRLSSRSMREALPRAGRLSVLTWPTDRPASLQAFAMREVLSAGRRGFRDGRDRPPAASGCGRGRGDHPLRPCGAGLHAHGSQVTSAARVATRLPEFSPQRHLVTRGSRAGVAPESVSRLLRMPLLAAMGDQRGLDEAINLGAGPARSRRGTLARAARTCASALLAERPAAA